MPRRASIWLSLLGSILPAPAGLAAQGLPAYAPINPVAVARSGLTTQPYLEPGKRWRFALQTDYANIIEYAVVQNTNVIYLLDAEVLRVQLSVSRSIGAKAFVLAETSFNGSYDGFMDGFLNWYHNLLGIHFKARAQRPKNQFAYELNLPGGQRYSYGPSSGFLGDVRLGFGLRHSSHWQSVVFVTLPTSSKPAGYRKGTFSANATTTLRSEFGKHFLYEGTFGAGYTPTHGELSDLQHTTFLMVTQGIRAKVAGALHAYANLIYHSAYYHDTGTKGMDNRELTIDFGGMLRFKRGPEWIFGLTEDLEPKGPAIDLSIRLGARW